MSMKDLPLSLRPRERLLACGAQALAPEELLAVLLRTGLPGQGVMGLAKALLQEFKGLAGLLAARPQDLKRVKGLGPAKRAEIVAVMELARRASAQELALASVFNSPSQLKRYAALHLAQLEHESFCVLYLDIHHRLIEMQTLFRGTLAQASVYPREVVKEALARNAAAVVLAHNHPSGVAEPSRADEFARAVGPVTQVPDKGLADLRRPRPAPEPLQRQLDEQQALQEALSDEVDIESLLLTDDGLSFRRPGIGPDVVTKLRRGHWAIQSQIDLHGLRRDEAREALSAHIRESLRRGHRCVRVVHGKGHGSPGRQPVLKAKVQRWLGQSAEVVAFAQASGPQGGAGALIVLLTG